MKDYDIYNCTFILFKKSATVPSQKYVGTGVVTSKTEDLHCQPAILSRNAEGNRS
jgi:hypothetical protein